jgi:hypothetical protein
MQGDLQVLLIEPSTTTHTHMHHSRAHACICSFMFRGLRRASPVMCSASELMCVSVSLSVLVTVVDLTCSLSSSHE